MTERDRKVCVSTRHWPTVAVFAYAVMSLILGGCVTESVTPSRGTPVATSRGGTALLANGPVAKPAVGASTTISTVQVAVAPLGIIEYDGLSLPLVSPDGRFVVSRVGSAPGWPAMLATAGAIAPANGGFRIYSISDKTLVPIELGGEIPVGCLLGRDCDSQGFLIERLNADGSRSIGKVNWLTGEFVWLVESSAVNAHAVFHGDGLLFSRRDVDASVAALVLLTGRGEVIERNAAGGSYTMPLPSSDGAIAWALRTSAAGTEIESVRIGVTGFGKTLSRTVLTSSAQPAASFQLSASMARCGPLTNGETAPALAILSTKLNGVASIDIETGRAGLISRGAIAVTPVALKSIRGYICTTDDGLVYVPEDVASSGAPRTDARLLSVPFIVRATGSESAPFVMFGPAANAPDRMELFRMAVTSGAR